MGGPGLLHTVGRQGSNDDTLKEEKQPERGALSSCSLPPALSTDKA